MSDPAGPVVEYPLLDAEPSRVLQELRHQGPIASVRLWDGRRAWLVTRYADAVRALTDQRLSADASDPNFPSVNPSQPVPNQRGGPARTHEARQAVIRRVVASEFTVRATARWRRVAERIAAEQVAAMLREGPPADLIPAFAVPVPLRLICRVVGVPERDVEFVRAAAQMSIARTYESSRSAQTELREFIEGLLRADQTGPRDGLLGQLSAGGLDSSDLARHELVDLLLVIMVAGHTTTANTIALSVLNLLENPERYQALREDPALVAPMVEEFLRIQTVVSDGAPRVAKQTLTLGGVTIRAGEAVIVSLTSANRDELVFADPDLIQLHRPGVHRHLAFGWGVHRCLGQHLARMELRVALTTLARTIPTLRLDLPFEQLRYAQGYQHLQGIRELPVTWT